MLHNHYSQLLRLDGLEVVSEQQVSDVLGVKGFPAKKIFQLSRKTPTESIKKAISLLAAADLDLKGKTAWPPELVTEVLVARLSALPKR
jgi:DNA polymerase III delta subunit